MSKKNTVPKKGKKKERLILQVTPFYRKIKVKIPPELVAVALQMDELVPNDEWMILTRVNEYKEGEIILDTDFVIPEQTVSGGSVEPHEKPVEYNVAIHRHPSGVKSFSGTDWEYLNQSFPISLLWVDRKFETGTMQVETPAGFTWIELVPELMISEELEKTVKEKVKKQYIYSSKKTNGFGTPNYSEPKYYYTSAHYSPEDMSSWEDITTTDLDELYNRGAMTIVELLAKDPDMSIYQVQAELEKRGIYLTTEEIERMMFGF